MCEIKVRTCQYTSMFLYLFVKYNSSHWNSHSSLKWNRKVLRMLPLAHFYLLTMCNLIGVLKVLNWSLKLIVFKVLFIKKSEWKFKWEINCRHDWISKKICVHFQGLRKLFITVLLQSDPSFNTYTIFDSVVHKDYFVYIHISTSWKTKLKMAV